MADELASFKHFELHDKAKCQTDVSGGIEALVRQPSDLLISQLSV
jgi:hypothetical protein